MSNAVKYTPEGGEIEVKLQLVSEDEAGNFLKQEEVAAGKEIFSDTKWLQCSVRDTGIGKYFILYLKLAKDNNICKGISTEMIPSIFRRFSKAEVLLKQEIRGSGLGLPICKV